MPEYLPHIPPTPQSSIFAVPILDRWLIYAPLHNLAALVDLAAYQRLREGPSGDASPGPLGDIARILSFPPDPAPQPRQGPLAPLFLGLLPTRGCNLACRYCGFLPERKSQGEMSLELARDAVNAYMDLVQRNRLPRAEVHFFGGEPFEGPDVLDLAVALARRRAREIGCPVRFEVTTNATFSPQRCAWAADNLDTIIISLDGPADIQDRYRPAKNGRSSLAATWRNARALAEGSADLALRSCVTSETVERMPEIARWFCAEFRPGAVCFEPVLPPAHSGAGQLEPPDAWAFARNFIAAARILQAHGIDAVYSAADIRARRFSLCPAGQDTLIVSPDGTISSCYLLPSEWESRGLDLSLGRVEGGEICLDASAIEATRALNVRNKPFCQRCFCRWHCAGGCHVHHRPQGKPGDHRLCVQTRLIALRNILQALGQDDLARAWLDSQEAAERSAYQPSDLLLDLEMG